MYLHAFLNTDVPNEEQREASGCLWGTISQTFQLHLCESPTHNSLHLRLSIGGGTVASWLVCSTPDQVVRIWALACIKALPFLNYTLYVMKPTSFVHVKSYKTITYSFVFNTKAIKHHLVITVIIFLIILLTKGKSVLQKTSRKQ